MMNVEQAFYKAVEKELFLNEFVNSICNGSIKLLETVKHARNYRARSVNGSYELACDAYGYEYEFDITLGCYRFRWKKEGPWTRWAAV